jgi:hypothetical protein
MTLLEAALVGAAIATIALVWTNLRAREAANAAIRRVCAQEGLLLLDDTVALASMWPARNADGRLMLRRVFGFDYSDTGHNRRTGSVTLLGSDVLDVSIAVAVPGDASRH